MALSSFLTSLHLRRGTIVMRVQACEILLYQSNDLFNYSLSKLKSVFLQAYRPIGLVSTVSVNQKVRPLQASPIKRPVSL